MVKTVKILRIVLICTVVSLLSLLIFGFFSIPDEISTLDSEGMKLNVIYSLDPLDNRAQTFKNSGEGVIDVKVNLFKAIPVKNSRVKVQRRRYVVPSGEIFGLRLYTRGVVVISTDIIDTPSGAKYPAKDAGIVKGDIIIAMNGKAVNDHTQVSDMIKGSEGNAIKIAFVRNGQSFETLFTPVYSSAQGKFVGGLWIRDSAAGIGTMTFYEKSTGAYGGLGHAVCDVDTGEILPLSEGDIVEAKISGCHKGRSGEAGELCGSFSGDAFGELFGNTSSGVFGLLGTIKNNSPISDEMPVAVKSEVKTGKARIISTVDETGPQYYDIEIEKIYIDDAQNRNMIIRITDEKLLEKTGGIVQGMSGSPIVQNKMLVGAVTHVFINEPGKGYAIFAENMIEKCDEVLKEEFQKAS